MKTTILLLIILFYCQPGIGQEIKKTDSLSYELNKVTVTATRAPVKILEIPYAVSFINNQDIQNNKGYGLNEVLSSVPGVLSLSRAGTQDVRIVIRGFGARGAGDRSNAGTSRGIRVMMDGFPETEPDGRTSYDLIDLSAAENIEVMRSNASALWGNASGGIINVSSVPHFEDSYMGVYGMAGSFGFSKYYLNFGTTLGNGKIFGSVINTEFEGWRGHSSSKRNLLNIGMTSQLAEQTQLGVFLAGSNNIFHIPGPLTQAQFDSAPQQANAAYAARDERRYNRLGRIGVTLSHRINDGNEISAMSFVNPKYLQRSERGTFRDFTRYHTGGNALYRNSHKFGEQLLNKLTLGIDEAYQDGAILFYSLTANNGRGSTLRDNKSEGANNFGVFVQDEMTFNEKLHILLGGRLDNVSYSYENYADPVLINIGLQEKKFKRFTPKAGVLYQLSPTQSIYANLGGGIEAPAGNETDPSGYGGQDTVYLINPLLEPIISTTIEAGIKQIFNMENAGILQSMGYELALYSISVKNDIIPYRGGRFYFTAGKTARTGIEAGTSLSLQGGFSLKGALTFSSNTYSDYTVDSAHYNSALLGHYANYKDNKVAGVPGMFYNLSATYSPEVLHGLYVMMNVNGVGKYFVDDANTIEVPSFTIINATVGLNKPLQLNNTLALTGFVSINNLTDATYAASAFINPDVVGGKPVFLEPGLPRNITASLGFIF